MRCNNPGQGSWCPAHHRAGRTNFSLQLCPLKVVRETLCSSALCLLTTHYQGSVRQVAVTLSGYTLATPYTPAAANVSAPIYYGVGAPLRDHFLHWRARAPMRSAHAIYDFSTVQQRVYRHITLCQLIISNVGRDAGKHAPLPCSTWPCAPCSASSACTS